jgi:hypothetical protein
MACGGTRLCEGMRGVCLLRRQQVRRERGRRMCGEVCSHPGGKLQRESDQRRVHGYRSERRDGRAVLLAIGKDSGDDSDRLCRQPHKVLQAGSRLGHFLQRVGSAAMVTLQEISVRIRPRLPLLCSRRAKYSTKAHRVRRCLQEGQSRRSRQELWSMCSDTSALRRTVHSNYTTTKVSASPSSECSELSSSSNSPLAD